MQIGMHRDDIPKSEIIAATFHPFEDVWWVRCKCDGEPAVLVITDEVVSDILRFRTEEEAKKKFLSLAAGKG